MNELTFKDCSFDVIDNNGQVWIRGPQIGVALGYANPSKKIAELYARHADEFTQSIKRPVTPADISRKRNMLLSEANDVIKIFSDERDAGIISDDDLVRWKAWGAYQSTARAGRDSHQY